MTEYPRSPDNAYPAGRLSPPYQTLQPGDLCSAFLRARVIDGIIVRIMAFLPQTSSPNCCQGYWVTGLFTGVLICCYFIALRDHRELDAGQEDPGPGRAAQAVPGSPLGQSAIRNRSPCCR